MSSAQALVGDVLEFQLGPRGWPGAFGFVTLRLHRGTVDGKDVFFVRTDASDSDFAKKEKLVAVPRLRGLIQAGATGAAYLVTGGPPDQAVVLSTEPGRKDYTPAWRVHRVAWKRAPRKLSSASDVESAQRSGDISVEQTDIVLNGPIVKWSTGEMAVDTERKEYLGGGQLLERPDISGLRVTFKLHECFPDSRYIVADTSMMADMMKIVDSSGLAAASNASASGRVNVFMKGIKGPGPMGFQPSVFDSRAGEAQWSPYWDHYVYVWKDESKAKVLRSQQEIHAARDRGELDEIPGVPETKGQVFTVNCPVPVIAPNTFNGG